MKIFFDENFSPYLASGLSEFQNGFNEPFKVLHIAKYFERGIPDENWIPQVAKMHGAAITKDNRISRIKHQWELCQKYKLGLFIVKTPNSYRHWDIVKLTVKHWDEIKRLTLSTQRPFAFIVKPKSIKPM